MRAALSLPRSHAAILRTGRGHAALLVIGVAAWLAGIGGGLAVLANYASRAPTSAHAPSAWPAASALAREEGAAAAVLFIHPKCPCSSATLNELNRLLARAGTGHAITIAFYAPTSEDPEWGRTSLRRQAEAIPGVRVVDDPDGREAALFGATHSGHVVVFAPGGELRFRGGITASRGHEGDNLGADCVRAALLGGPPPAATTPTFGCEIAPPAPDDAACPHCDEGPPT